MSGTPGNDDTILAAAADIYDALAGNDTIRGAGGNDSIFGNDGNDVLFGDTGANTAAGGEAQADTLIGGAGNDQLYGEGGDDHLSGDADLDTLLGGEGNDTLLGGAGDDLVEGGAGADVLDGGAGIDTLSYANASGGVLARFGSNPANTRDAMGDTPSNFEVLEGSDFNDRLFDGNAGRTLLGGAGDDQLFGSFGTDLLDGGIGIDLADYQASAVAVNVNLATRLGTGDDAEGDTLRGIENVQGGRANDTLTGDGIDNVLRGGPGGDDVLSGGGGNDTLLGGNQDDLLTGGTDDDSVDGEGGNDRAVWNTGEGNDTLIGGTGTDTLDIGSWTGPSIATDTLPDGVYGVWTVTGGTGPDVSRVFSNGTHQVTASSFEAIACFARGTRIATAQGEVAVEALRIGDLVVTGGRSAGLQPVQWIGRSRAEVSRHPAREKVAPVIIRAGALGEGVPYCDLRVSPDHALYLDGHLVPAKYLINGTSIVQELWCPAVEYWHVELPEHAVIVSAGALTESYLDDGNRDQFDNGAIARLFVDFEAHRTSGGYERAACYPVLRGGRKLEEIRARLVTLPPAGMGRWTSAARSS